MKRSLYLFTAILLTNSSSAHAVTKNQCTSVPSMAQLLPKSKAVFAGYYQRKIRAPALGGGILSTISTGSVTVFNVTDIWGDGTDNLTVKSDLKTIKVAGDMLPTNHDKTKQVLIFAIRDADYDKYYAVDRLPKDYYRDIVFSFPCGGIREINQQDLKKIKDFFAK